ncbi:nuclear transport factor 2 family protein [Aeromicrobium sp. CTD01-1L150]|uniref:nuclear transport factor 2 family protein n=1 Tax=Aeromicrobium sp. CTD01-1L150 TaxID=3341830 RepID=UPI0035C22D99
MSNTPLTRFQAAMAAMATGDEQQLAEFYSEETTYWDPLSGSITGLDVVPYLAGIGRQLEGITVQVESVMEDGRSACIEWVQRSRTSQGAHSLRGSTFVTVRHGIITRQHDYFDYRASRRG